MSEGTYTYYGPHFSDGYNPNTSVLAGLTVEQLQAWLAQAQMAYFSLASGQKAITVTYNQADGAHSVTYQRADMGMLTAMIMQIQRQLGIPGVRRAPRRPVYI